MLQERRAFKASNQEPRRIFLAPIRELASEIGPRRATSKAEAQAAAVVAGLLRRSGLEVTIQTFAAAAAPTAGLLGLVALGLLAAGAGYWLPLPSALLALWSSFLAWRELRGPAMLATLLRRRESQNVVGTRAASETPYWRVVLLCHLDSPPVLSVRSTRLLHLGLLLIPLALFAQAALLLASHWWPSAWIAALVPLALLGLSGAVLLWRERWARWAPGAVSAAGAAVAAAAAATLQDLQYVELWVVATGAGAAGGAGTTQLLKRYPFPTGETCFINLPALGRGRLTLITREGSLRRLRSDRFLQMLIASVAAEKRIALDSRPVSVERLENSAPLARGYRAVSLAGLDPSGMLAGYRSADDDPQTLDQAQLEDALQLLIAVIRRLDRMGPA